MSQTEWTPELTDLWLASCRKIVEGQVPLFEESRTIAERHHYEGVGEGGDNTLRLDRQCEDVVFEEMEHLAADGLSFTVISEERGTVGFNGGDGLTVVVDPIDGSLNVRRTLPSHSLSIAVATGDAMDSVAFGFVHDFGSGEEFSASIGAGAFLDGRRLEVEDPGNVEMLELVGVEGAEPSAFLPFVEGLAGSVYRLRCVGSLAITVSWLAASRIDAMTSPHPSRSVDVAAAQLIAREAGALVELGEGDLSTIGLGLEKRFPVMGSTSAGGLEIVRRARPAA